MTEIKIKPTDKSVLEFLSDVTPESNRLDGIKLYQIFNVVTKEPAVMWGENIVGYGKYRYDYGSGEQGEMFITGFSPSTHNFAIYLSPNFEQFEGLLSKLGEYKAGKSCIYIDKLADVDLMILKQLIEKSIEDTKAKYDNN
ncbi:MAG: DUF1801 domain-containing protein [Leeuwenhoekiella sp.]